MMYDSEIEEYIREVQPKDANAKKRIQKCLEVLSGENEVTLPFTGDFESILKPELLELRGHKKDTTLSGKTADDYISVFRKFNEWRKRKENEAMNLFEENEGEQLANASDVGVNEAGSHEVEPHGFVSENENDVVEATSFEPVNESRPDVPEENAPVSEEVSEHGLHKTLKKRGRKKQPENEHRTQISAYLSNEVYAGIKALSVMTQQPISDIVSQVMNGFYDDNIEVINESIKVIEHSESVKLKIKYRR